MSPLFGRKDHEDGTAQGIEVLQAEFDRLNALPIRQLAAEVLVRGFGPGGPGADDEDVTVGQMNIFAGPSASLIAKEFASYRNLPSSTPSAQEKLWNRIVRLIAEGLQELEHASLVRAQMHTSSGSFDYATTRRGRAALDRGEVERILASRPE
jgi:hypothetical protein